jgi:spermidine synthase
MSFDQRGILEIGLMQRVNVVQLRARRENAMTFIFEELDFRKTPLGEISLRRRSEPMLQGMIVYEVRLDDEFLMSSLFTESEVALARLGLASVTGAKHGNEAQLDVIVGGLGLGYTALAVLQNRSVRSLIVIEVMDAVIDWHRSGLVPLGPQLTSDRRCKLVHADFFSVAASNNGGFDRTKPNERVHAVLLDIDHSPRHWLDPAHSKFYTAPALRNLADKLHPGGVFGLWSNDPPDPDFTRLLDSVFASSECHTVAFANPYTGGESSNTVYLASKAQG